MSNLAPADRHDWLQTVLGMGMGLGQEQGQGAGLLEGADPAAGTAVAALAAATADNPFAITSAATSASGGISLPPGTAPAPPASEHSWREALLQLRTLFPGAGNYSGVGVELDDAETAMSWRLADMRGQLARNLRRGADKLARARRRAAARAAGLLEGEEDEEDADYGGEGEGGEGGEGGRSKGPRELEQVNVYAVRLGREDDEQEAFEGEGGPEFSDD